MYEVCFAVRFEAAHRLVGDFGPASRTHGQAVEALAGSMHYRDLNEVPGLTRVNTTAEAVASFCWEELAQSLRGQGLDSLTVRIWESPDAYAAREDTLA